MKRGRPSTTQVGPSATKKTKTDPNAQKYYAVRAGFHPGVYLTWYECQLQTAGFKGAQYKSFLDRQDAEAFVAGENPKMSVDGPEPDKFYAVAVGAFTGIFSDWDRASLAIKGVKGPKYKKFATREEAVQFIRQYGSDDAIAALDAKESHKDEAGASSGSGKRKSKAAAAAAAAAATAEVKDLLKIYTDGSSLKNGKSGAAAGVGVFFGKGDSRNLSERLVGEPQTNQRAELSAILRALQLVPVSQPIQIHSDSQYSINCATIWADSWEKKAWKTADGSDVKNQDLVKAIRVKMVERQKRGARTLFKWVKGHADDVGNTAADKLAVTGAKKPRTD